MNEEEKNIRQEGEDKPGKEVSQGRRDTLKALVAVPVLGAMAYGVYQKKKKELTKLFPAGDTRHPNQRKTLTVTRSFTV